MESFFATIGSFLGVNASLAGAIVGVIFGFFLGRISKTASRQNVDVAAIANQLQLNQRASFSVTGVGAQKIAVNCSGRHFEIDQSVFSNVKAMLQGGDKIAAIKLLRENYSLDLALAKQLAEVLERLG